MVITGCLSRQAYDLHDPEIRETNRTEESFIFPRRPRLDDSNVEMW